MKRTINKPKKKSPKKKLEIKKNSKPLNKTKKDKRNLTEVINSNNFICCNTRKSILSSNN